MDEVYGCLIQLGKAARTGQGDRQNPASGIDTEADESNALFAPLAGAGRILAPACEMTQDIALPAIDA